MATVAFEPVKRISVDGVVVSERMSACAGHGSHSHVKEKWRLTGCGIFTVNGEHPALVSFSFPTIGDKMQKALNTPDDTGLSTSLLSDAHDSLVVLAAS